MCSPPDPSLSGTIHLTTHKRGAWRAAALQGRASENGLRPLARAGVTPHLSDRGLDRPPPSRQALEQLEKLARRHRPPRRTASSCRARRIPCGPPPAAPRPAYRFHSRTSQRRRPAWRAESRATASATGARARCRARTARSCQRDGVQHRHGPWHRGPCRAAACRAAAAVGGLGRDHCGVKILFRTNKPLCSRCGKACPPLWGWIVGILGLRHGPCRHHRAAVSA